MGWVNRARAVLECQNEDLASKDNKGDISTRNILLCRFLVTLLKDASCPFIVMKLELFRFLSFPCSFHFSPSFLFLRSLSPFLLSFSLNVQLNIVIIPKWFVRGQAL